MDDNSAGLDCLRVTGIQKGSQFFSAPKVFRKCAEFIKRSGEFPERPGFFQPAM